MLKIASTQPQTDPLSPRLRDRLRSLGLTAVCLHPDGHHTVFDQPLWLDQFLLQNKTFQQTCKQAWPALLEAKGLALELWPQVWLIPLHHPLPKRHVPSPQSALSVVILIGRAFLESDQFHLLCDQAKLDRQVLLTHLDQTHEYPWITGPIEAQRMASMLSWMQHDHSHTHRQNNEIYHLTQQLGESYEELSLLYKLTTGMTLDRAPQQFLSEACQDMQQVAGLNWLALKLVSNVPSLGELSGQVFITGDLACDPQTFHRISDQLILQLISPSNTTPPIVINDTSTLNIPLISRLARQLLVVGLVHEEKLLGVIVGGDKLDGQHLTTIDAKLCNSLASGLTMFLDNLILYEDMAAMFQGALHALTASIDAKDPYTFGHSERVAILSRQLALASGLDEHTAQRIYLSALVHDVGKIGVPETVLCKPGKLTSEEFDIIRTHPSIGAKILEDIPQMHDLIPGVLHHHERWDGKGYPHKLAAEEIPLFGRVIGLADSFDAMSSTRTYRAAMSHQQVLEEIARCSGTQFDPQLAQTFLQLDFHPFREMVQKHQNQQGQPTISSPLTPSSSSLPAPSDPTPSLPPTPHTRSPLP